MLTDSLIAGQPEAMVLCHALQWLIPHRLTWLHSLWLFATVVTYQFFLHIIKHQVPRDYLLFLYTHISVRTSIQNPTGKFLLSPE